MMSTLALSASLSACCTRRNHEPRVRGRARRPSPGHAHDVDPGLPRPRRLLCRGDLAQARLCGLRDAGAGTLDGCRVLSDRVESTAWPTRQRPEANLPTRGLSGFDGAPAGP